MGIDNICRCPLYRKMLVLHPEPEDARRRDLNPYVPFETADFKSAAFTDFATRALAGDYPGRTKENGRLDCSNLP